MCAQTAETYGGQEGKISPAEILSTSFRYHQAGQFKEAAEGYEALLRENPQHSDALYLLGILAQQLGQTDTAIQLIKAAIVQSPATAHFHHSLGEIYLQLDRKAEAADCFQQAFLLNPQDRNPLQAEDGLPVGLNDPQGSHAAEKYWELGNQKFKSAQYFHAEILYRRALELKPDYPACHRNLGQALIRQNKFQEAVEACQKAIELNPEFDAAYNDLGFTHLQLRNFPQSESAFRKALEINSNAPATHYNLGNLLRQQFRLEEAAASYRTALKFTAHILRGEVQPGSPATVRMQAMNNLALTLNELGQVDKAIECYREAIVLYPENADLHYSLATALLLSGNFEEGWKEHEWRWQMPTFSTKLRDFGCPLWKGEPLDGRKILLHAEQGYGDTLQFVRYLPMVMERGGEVILEVPACLTKFLQQIPGIAQMIVQGEPLPEASWHCPLMSLPLVFGTTLETIPSAPAYLSVSQEVVSAAKAQWPGEGLRVGLAWSGNPKHFLDTHRSAHLSQLMSLSSVAGVSFYSLQTGETVKQITEVAPAFQIRDVCSQFTDFADTAAFISGLDLVITVDTSIAHLAGALGIPVWILLAHNRIDWRWLRDRSDSPWYPSARIFRQPKPGDWAGLADHLRQELHRLVKNHAAIHDSSTEKTAPDIENRL